MGCATSRTHRQVAEHARPLKKATLPRAGSDSLRDSPKPLIFSIIRNGHEVIRGGLKDVEAFLQRNELELAVTEWEKLRKWIHTHRRMELGASTNERNGAMGFLKLLDKHCGGISTKENFLEGYQTVERAEEELNAAFETNDLFQIRGFFYDYKDAMLHLLRREDKILMPQINEMAKRNLNLKSFMQQHVLGAICNSFGFEQFIRFAFRTLEKHHGGMPRVRVYGYALWAVATKKQWELWQVWIQECVSESSFHELQEVIRNDAK